LIFVGAGVGATGAGATGEGGTGAGATEVLGFGAILNLAAAASAGVSL